MGNVNRDQLQDNIKNPWLKYMDSFGISQLINIPTMVTIQSETLTDPI